MRSHLPRIRSFTNRHPRATVAIAILVLLASIMVLTRARFDTDVTRLIPAHAEKTALYFDIASKTGDMEKAYLVFSGDGVKGHLRMIDAIGREVEALPSVRRVEWKITDEARTFLRDVFARKAPLLLLPKEMDEFLFRLSPAGMDRELGKTYRRLLLPGGQEALTRIDPLNLHEVFSPHLNMSDVSFDPLSGYFLAADGKKAVMIITPARPPRDVSFARDFVSAVESVVARYRIAGLDIRLTGSHAITLHEASAMKSEIIKNASASFAAVAVIFLLFFRSLSGLAYVMLPVLASIVATMGLAFAVTGALSEVTGAFAGLIVGLGIDVGIVLYARYLLNLEGCSDRTQCMDRSIAEVHRGITTGIVTTALIFFPMAFSSFRGLRELGILTGTGMILCWAFLLGVVSLVARPSGGRFVGIRFLGTLARVSAGRPVVVASTVLLLTALSLLFIPRIRVTGDLNELGTRNNPARSALQELQSSFIRDRNVIVTAAADDLQSALEKSLEIKASLSGRASGLTAAGDILPPTGRQQENLSLLERLDAPAILRDFDMTASRAGFRSGEFATFREGLRRMIENRALLTPEDLAPVQEALGRLLFRDGDRWQVVVTGAMDGTLPKIQGYAYTGPSFVREELLGILRSDAILISAIGLILVTIVLYLDFRSLPDVIFCQIPVFLAVLWTLGIMGASGISLNFMNALVFIMLFGIGTDYTVHLLHRFRRDGDLEATMLQTGKAVFVSGLTTIAGFGSIGFSSYHGLATMGQVAAVGTSLCVILSLSLIPLLLGLYERTAHRK